MMKKSILVAAVLAIGAGSAVAADLPAKMYTKAPPVVAFDPWDIAFGSAIMSDYIFRGITQSNHNPAATAYFEPRFNVNKDLQFYVGTAGTSISFPNRAAAEIDVYGGVRPTFGPAAFDFGVFGYLYPGGSCFNPIAGPGTGIPGSGADCVANGALPVNGNVIKRDLNFFEAYGKLLYTFNDSFNMGANVYYTPSFLNSGARGTYASVTAKYTAPGTFFGSSGIGSYISGEFGRQWLGNSDNFYSLPVGIAGGLNYADYNTWNVGIGFTYKVFTLDLRYSDTNLSRGDCNAFTSDFATRSFGAGNVTPINPAFVGPNGQVGAFGSNWCSARFVAKLSADLTAMTNLK